MAFSSIPNCCSFFIIGFLEGELISPLHCTVSVGVASTEGNRLIKSAELYKNADTQMYVAKHTGRNQVSMGEVVRVH